MANFQIPAPPSDKRPKNTYEWFGAIIKSLQDTKGVNWNVNNTLNIKELGNSIGNDKNFVATVDRKILESHTPIKLAPNTDLNTLTNNGIYTSDSDNNSQTLVNRPPGAQGFILRVYRIWSDIESRYRSIQIAYNRTTGFMYSRGKSESTDWTNWVGSLYTTDATSTNSANKLVIRDNSGNFSAGTITASLNGNASTATKLATARRLTIGSTGKTFNGTTDLTWTLDDIGAAPTAHNHTSIGSRGVVAAETGTQRPAVDGISMSQVYNNGYPISYGNVLTLSGGGKSQLLIGWGGTSGAHEKAYIRSKRDMDSASWSEWAQIYTSAHKPTPADIGALPVSGGQLSGNLTFSNSGTSLRGIEGFMAENDGWRVMGGGTATDAGYLEIATCDNGNEPIYVRQYTGTSTTTSFTNLVRSATLLDENGNTHFPGIMNIGGRRLACIAGHGGLDVGDTNVAIALCSKNQPLWYDGSNTRELVYSVKDSSGYPCMMSNNNGWIRTPPSGIIPNTSGTGGGRSSLGSQTWTFSSGYINEVYCTGITSVGDLWLTAKNANGYLISQGHIKPSGTAIKYLGESANRWHSVWAANGTIQTSDERFKVKQGLTNIEECFDMIKNTNIYNYVMIGQNKEDLSRNRLGKLAMEHSKIDSNVHMGVMAQDILDYDCAKQIIIEDEYERLDGTTDTMLSINPYNLTSALMGALKVEISKREELETTVSNLEEELSELKELVKSFLNK